MKEYSYRKNLNRGYMKLEVWHRSIDLYTLVWHLLDGNKIDFKVRSEIVNAAQSVSANIAEGYSRRSINEYMQHLYIALGSLSETLSRLIAFLEAGQIKTEDFEEVDSVHHEIENKLWNLLRSLEQKKTEGTWINKVAEELTEYGD